MSLKLKNIAFSQEELRALQKLRGSTTTRIICDEVSFWFEFREKCLWVTFCDYAPLSQNEHDEALALRPQWHDSPPWHESPSRPKGRILFENKKIEDILVVRTLLWFTDHVVYASREQALAGLAPPRSDTDRVLVDVLAKSTGGHDECITHPSLSHLVEAPVANLVDVGFLAHVGGRHLACFTQSNSTLRDGDFVDELDDFTTSYATVTLDDAMDQLAEGSPTSS